jgi:peptidoglycan biosynthesis protein MviN/MurJ (putative lipid II flippase)
LYEGRKHKLGEIVYSVVYNFLAKIVGFITTLLVSLKIGTTLDLDLYYLVTGLIGVVCGIIVTQESYYLVPKGLFIKTKLGFKSFTKYYNNVILIYTIILIVLAFLYLVFTLKLVELFSKYNIDQIRESKSLLKILAIYMFFTPINTLMGNILNSMNFFRISTFVTLISSLLTILCLIFFDDLGTTALYIGASLSSIGAFIYYILFLRSKGWEFSANFKRLKVEFTSDLLYANAMSFLAYFKGLINNYLISGLGRGVLTGLISDMVCTICQHF